MNKIIRVDSQRRVVTPDGDALAFQSQGDPCWYHNRTGNVMTDAAVLDLLTPHPPRTMLIPIDITGIDGGMVEHMVRNLRAYVTEADVYFCDGMPDDVVPLRATKADA